MSRQDALSRLFDALPPFLPGKVWVAGAGPGDPGLLTVEAAAALGTADSVVHDALVSAGVLALAGTHATLIPAGKRGGKPSAHQGDITETLIARARSGERVLRLKGGDPYVFGRGGEEVLALARAQIPFRVLPGVTAGLAGLSAASIPATMRGVNQALVLVTGHGAGSDAAFDWAALARLGQPIVLFMAIRTIGAIAARLIEGGLSRTTPAAAIASATTPDQKVCISTLGGIEDAIRRAGIVPPALVVIGDIVAQRAELDAALSNLVKAAP